MIKINRIYLPLLVALLAGGIFLLALDLREALGFGEPINEARSNGAGGQIDSATDSTVATQNAVANRAVQGQSSAAHIERHAKSLSEAAPALLDLAIAGDSKALGALNRLYNKCGALYRGTDGIEKKPTELSMLVLQAQERVGSYCDFGNLGLTSQELALAIDDIQRMFVESGDPMALFQHFSTPAYIGSSVSESKEEVIRNAWELASDSNDPEVVGAALDLLLGTWDSEGESHPAVGRILRDFNSDPALAMTGMERRLEIRRLASRWLACDDGAPCGPYASFQETRCIAFSNCASHLPVQEFIRQRLLSPPEYEAMMRLVSGVRSELERHG
jgi:hypothetical protein